MAQVGSSGWSSAFPTEEGTPQGGALSPLLANVALHGLEASIRAAFPVRVTRHGAPWQPLVIRYADDFVVLHEDIGAVKYAQQIAENWLAGMGLELKPSKTRIVHTLNAHAGQQAGFDFLGCTVRQFRVGRYHSAHATNGAILGFKTIIKPRRASQKRHLGDIAETVRRFRAVRQEDLIGNLNRQIGGWAAYYSTVSAKKVFSKMDHLVYIKLRAWARRRHPKKGAKWVASRYWQTQGTRRWVYGPKNGPKLLQYSDTPIRRHVRVRSDARFFNGDVLYWAARLGRHPEISKSRAVLLKDQQGRCPLCSRLFTRLDELIEVDHRLPRSLGGSHHRTNRQLVHAHCHDQKTTHDGSNRARSEVPTSRAKKDATQNSTCGMSIQD